MSSQSSKVLSEVLHLSLSSLDSLAVSHTEHMFSCWFVISCHQVMLSLCSQGNVYTSSLTHTLNHVVEDLLTGPPSISRTSAKLHCIVSALSHQVLLPKIVQILMLPPRNSTLRNLGIDLADYHPEQCIIFPRIHLNLCFLQTNPSILPLVNWSVWQGSDPGLHSSQNNYA